MIGFDTKFAFGRYMCTRRKIMGFGQSVDLNLTKK